MPCACGGKSQKKLSEQATRQQAQLEQARAEALAKKQIVYAAPPPSKPK